MFGLPAEDSYIWIFFLQMVENHTMSKTTCVFFFGSGPKIGGKDANIDEHSVSIN